MKRRQHVLRWCRYAPCLRPTVAPIPKSRVDDRGIAARTHHVLGMEIVRVADPWRLHLVIVAVAAVAVTMSWQAAGSTAQQWSAVVARTVQSNVEVQLERLPVPVAIAATHSGPGVVVSMSSMVRLPARRSLMPLVAVAMRLVPHLLMVFVGFVW